VRSHLRQFSLEYISECNLQFPEKGRSRIRIILIGTIEDVTQQIHRFRRCGLEVPQWSPPQRIPDTDEVVCVYIQNGGRSEES
jgi:hypothetical protein